MAYYGRHKQRYLAASFQAEKATRIQPNEVPDHPSLFDSLTDPIESLPMTTTPREFSDSDKTLDQVNDNEIDGKVLTFGKYIGKTPIEISKLDPAWLHWAFTNVKNRTTCSEELAEACKKVTIANKAQFDKRTDKRIVPR